METKAAQAVAEGGAELEGRQVGTEAVVVQSETEVEKAAHWDGPTRTELARRAGLSLGQTTRWCCLGQDRASSDR